MSPTIIALIVFIVLVLILAKKTLVVIPQSETKIIERLGKYHATLEPGINVKGCYFTLNTLKDVCRAKRQYKQIVKIGRGEGISDTDIARRDWLLVDLDPERKAGTSSTNAEKERLLKNQHFFAWVGVISWIVFLGLKLAGLDASGFTEKIASFAAGMAFAMSIISVIYSSRHISRIQEMKKRTFKPENNT